MKKTKKSNKQTRRATTLSVYKYLLNAKNARLIFLTGTPVINYPNELGILFNMLRGYIITYNFNLTQLTKVASDTAFKRIETVLFEHPLIDQFFINKKDSFVKITRAPLGFASTKDGLISVETIEYQSDNINTKL